MTIDTFNEHIEDFLAEYPCLRSQHSREAYRTDLLKFAGFVSDTADNPEANITPRIVLRYVSAMRKEGKSDSTMARRCASVSSYCEYLRCNFDPSFPNPAKMPRKTFVREQEPKPIDDVTRGLLLGGMDSLRDQFLFTLFAVTGLRVSEMQSLDRNSIVIERRRNEGGQYFLGKGEVVGKGNKRRTFFIDEPTLVLYAQYLSSRRDNSPALFLSSRGNRLSSRGMQYRLEYWCKRLGAPHLNVHRFRHSFATNLGNNHIDSNVLQKLMGHSSFNTTKKYLRLNEKTMAQNYFAAMELVNAREGIGSRASAQ